MGLKENHDGYPDVWDDVVRALRCWVSQQDRLSRGALPRNVDLRTLDRKRPVYQVGARCTRGLTKAT